MSDPILTPQDRNSAVWQKIETYLDDKIARKRAENDAPLNAEQTATLRGYIACLKDLKKLNSDKPTAPIEDAVFQNLE
jgi:hypothetical protein